MFRKHGQKKVPETDAIFDNVARQREIAATQANTLRISIDTKAKVKIGDSSRGGSSRSEQAVQAGDHDMGYDALLVPFGILEQSRGDQAIDQPFLVFGESRETSDFLADSIELWWNERKTEHLDVDCIQIELDNGPEISSSRTQFKRRMVEFSDRHQVTTHLVYFLPYHSKYNPIERVWAILERHWNGTLLETTEIALQWAKTFTWKGHLPIVRRIESIYEKGIKLTKSAFAIFKSRLDRSETVAKWSVRIKPHSAVH